jgi:hypothetical protein
VHQETLNQQNKEAEEEEKGREAQYLLIKLPVQEEMLPSQI